MDSLQRSRWEWPLIATSVDILICTRDGASRPFWPEAVSVGATAQGGAGSGAAVHSKGQTSGFSPQDEWKQVALV